MAFRSVRIGSSAGPGPWAGTKGSTRQIITVQFDERQLKFFQRRLRKIEGGMPLAVSRAINHILAKERTRVLRLLARKIGIAQKLLRKQVKVYKASSRPIKGSRRGGVRFMTMKERGALGGKLWIGSQRRSIAKLGGRAGARLLKKAMKGGGAFEATMPGGRHGFFVRKTRMRLPIEELRTPSPAEVARSEGIDTSAEARLSAALGVRLNHEMNFLLSKHGMRTF